MRLREFVVKDASVLFPICKNGHFFCVLIEKRVLNSSYYVIQLRKLRDLQ